MEPSLKHKATLKAVTVSVTYHRNCFVVVDNMTDYNIKDVVREQIKMPNNPSVDISDWSEDEFEVIEDDETDIVYL